MNVFPQTSGQGFMVSKGPKWNTIVKQAASGRQVRVGLQAAPIYQFKVGYEFIRDRTLNSSELQELWAFFNNAQGQLNTWLFQDPYDYVVPLQQFATGNGSTTSFQLTRTVGPGSSYPYVEPIFATYGSITVEINGTVTTAYTLQANGVIQFNTAPANGAVLSWSGGFYFVCHFTQDDLSPEQMVYNLWSLDGLQFESVVP